MQPPSLLLRRATAALVVTLSLLSVASGHNITKILAKHPEFSTFNHFLTITHLAGEINRRSTITICALDNAAMAPLLSLNTATVKNILCVHVLLDYFGAKKLHQITDGTAIAATMYQATGTAPGSAGFVNITDQSGGRVAFAPEDNNGTFPSHFVKSVEEIPYNISVIHISQIIASDTASAPVPEPAALNLTASMSAHGCKAFADALEDSPAAIAVFQDNLAGGLTVFCPSDEAFKEFGPKYANLTAAGKAALLQIHGVPTYNSRQMLRSSNGVLNTLATDGASKFEVTVQNDGDDVTVKTKLVTAKITDTLLDEDPVSIFVVDKVLKPRELFKKDKAEAPAPEAEAPEADAPEPAKGKKTKKKAAAAADEEAPADSPGDEDPADSTADENGGGGLRRFQGLSGVVVSVLLGFLVM